MPTKKTIKRPFPGDPGPDWPGSGHWHWPGSHFPFPFPNPGDPGPDLSDLLDKRQIAEIYVRKLDMQITGMEQQLSLMKMQRDMLAKTHSIK